ncbi:mitochondrial carrier [Phanerochaete sordida]|uniref:Mitochondrial carrier n=1 Tax=Phanerochaete sordida TaxID=48140 RepID=A0A9P3LHS0_9APHY|nr:mitochondrial carrier [Phanerochaete sordida]
MAAPERKPLPFVANFAAGAIAGVSEILTFYPLDVVKTRMQLETGKSNAGLVGTFKNIVAQEGFGRLYRGLVPPLLLEAPKRATKFAANDFWGKTYLNLTGQKKMTQELAILTGSSAGATESFVVVPFELVKIKLQDKHSTFAGPMDVVKTIIKKEGLLGLYVGMESTFWRHLWWNAGYFGCIFKVREMLPKPETNRARLLNDLAAGTVGGFVGTAINTPFDVVKSRIQGATKVPGVVPKYNWTYPGLLLIAREEGIGALYKGFAPKVLRLAPGGGVLLLVVEFTLGIFRKALGPPYI